MTTSKPAPSTPPVPAPGELDLDEMERLARECVNANPWHDWFTADGLKARTFGLGKPFAEFIAFCTPERVAQLVAAARSSAEISALAVKHGWREEFAEIERTPLGFIAALLNDRDTLRSAARASRPTEETDGGQQQEQLG